MFEEYFHIRAFLRKKILVVIYFIGKVRLFGLYNGLGMFYFL
jgi:hypothetical protein